MDDLENNEQEDFPFAQVLDHLADDSAPFPARLLARFSGLEGEELSDVEKHWPLLGDMRKISFLEDLELLAEGNTTMDFDAIGSIAIDDQDEKVRELGLRNLWQTDDEQYFLKVNEILQSDPILEVRAQAAALLGRYILLGELGQISEKIAEKASQALFVIMENENIDKLCQRALESLGNSGDSRVPGLIEDAYDFGDEDMQAAAIFAMGRTADERWIPIIIEQLNDPNPELIREAARASGELEIDEAIPLLINLLHDEVMEIRLASAWSLSQIGGEEASEALEDFQSRSEDEDEVDFIEDALDNLTFNLELDELHILDFSKEDLEQLSDPEDDAGPEENN